LKCNCPHLWPSLLALLTLPLLVGCPNPPAESNDTGTTPIGATEDSLTEFQAIAARLHDDEGGFFEQGAQQRLRKQRDSRDDDIESWLTLTFELINRQLQEGDTETALAEVNVLFSVLEQSPEYLQREPRFHLLRSLVHLRRAEVENCVKRHNAQCCLFPLAGGGVHSERGPATEAKAAYLAFLQKRPGDLRARWLLNLTCMALGEYPEGVPEQFRIPVDTYDSTTDIGRFPDIAPALGLDTFNLCGGSVVDDIDGDGRLDVVTTTIDPLGPMTYHRNNGDGSFEDRSSAAGLDQQLGGLNLFAADYDNDGDLDLFVTRGAWMYDEGRIRNSLLRNEPDGTFTDVTYAAGLAEPSAPTQVAAWADFDNDGLLDLFIGNESRADITKFAANEIIEGNYPSQLFHNNGDGTFTDIAVDAGVTNDRYAKGVTAGDYDNDGDMDLYISNIGKNRLYRNNGDLTFTDVAPARRVTEPDDRSFVPWFFDYDNDGWLDLFVTAYDAELDDIAADYMGLEHNATAPVLYNNRNGRFKNVTTRSGLNRPMLPMGANFGDLDNDGWLDMYITTGKPDFESLMPNVMLRNDGGNRFEDVTRTGGFGHLQKGHGVGFADIDDDGDIDIYHQVGGFFPGDAFHNALFENPGHGNHFVKMQLTGTTSNRDANGARIMVVADTPDGSREFHRAVGSVSSFGGSPRRQHIGLGDASAIDRIEITWPASGTVQILEDVPLDSNILITEGQDGFTPLQVEPIDFN
jgi:hypothetical protein